jgi:hypothetical protein
MLKAALIFILTALLAASNPTFEQINYVLTAEQYQGRLTDEEIIDLVENSNIEDSLKISFINKLLGIEEITADITESEPVIKLPSSKYLNAKKYYSQKNKYPHGCELIALMNSMLRMGLDPDVNHFNIWYFISEDFTSKNGNKFGPDPELAYAGDPTSEKGFYSFEKVSIRSGNHYLKDQNSVYRLKSITGADVYEIKSYIDSGFPVVFWALINFESAAQYSEKGGWYINGTDKFYQPYSNLHCMTVVGYDDEKGFKICDSLASSEYWVSYDKFTDSTAVLGNRMITYYKQ